MGRDRCPLTSSSMHLSTRMLAKEKLTKICRERSESSSDRKREFSAQNNKKRRTTMTTFKTLIAAALVSMTAVTSVSAQLPNWAAQYPDAFQAQYPDRDVLNGGALTPAGRMGLVLPHPAPSSIIPTTPHPAPSSVTMVVAMPASDASSKVSLNHNDQGATATRRRILL